MSVLVEELAAGTPDKGNFKFLPREDDKGQNRVMPGDITAHLCMCSSKHIVYTTSTEP